MAVEVTSYQAPSYKVSKISQFVGFVNSRNYTLHSLRRGPTNNSKDIAGEADTEQLATETNYFYQLNDNNAE